MLYLVLRRRAIYLRHQVRPKECLLDIAIDIVPASHGLGHVTLIESLALFLKYLRSISYGVTVTLKVKIMI